MYKFVKGTEEVVAVMRILIFGIQVFIRGNVICIQLLL